MGTPLSSVNLIYGLLPRAPGLAPLKTGAPVRDGAEPNTEPQTGENHMRRSYPPRQGHDMHRNPADKESINKELEPTSQDRGMLAPVCILSRDHVFRGNPKKQHYQREAEEEKDKGDVAEDGALSQFPEGTKESSPPGSLYDFRGNKGRDEDAVGEKRGGAAKRGANERNASRQMDGEKKGVEKKTSHPEDRTEEGIEWPPGDRQAHTPSHVPGGTRLLKVRNLFLSEEGKKKGLEGGGVKRGKGTGPTERACIEKKTFY
ncbi:hypothetical protein NDU88_000466 [Pleurodeles waltl]|uniref:Uncharacterized protein n=1 Tax=Pleurodeles waltl TaxID=8319 RepID=A0AAV7SWJ2_PLEWA|nr:hypothetical protein NDU88_000466 [Pleurodeles waltl]